jgi:hypothetical protein
MNGALEVERLLLKGLSGEGLGGGGALLGTLEDMSRKDAVTDISLNRGPFMADGNLEGDCERCMN